VIIRRTLATLAFMSSAIAPMVSPFSRQDSNLRRTV
jgi:hypothetical protein